MITILNIHISNFDNILKIQNKIKNLLEDLYNKINKLTETYTNLLQDNNDSHSIYGLDSLYFQMEIIKYEYKELNKYYDYISNRIYYNYYKLYKFIQKYISQEIKYYPLEQFIKNTSNYPKYNDLNVYQKYDFKIIEQLHSDIIEILSYILNYITEKENQLEEYLNKKSLGLNINNFVSTYSHNINQIKQNIELYNKYLSSLYLYHHKYLTNFIDKLSLISNQTNNEINQSFMNSSVHITKVKDCLPSPPSQPPENTIIYVVNDIVGNLINNIVRNTI